MLIRFREEIPLPVSDVYAYFKTPADWVRLYGFGGEVEDRGEGWYAVPLRRFPFPLVARITTSEPDHLVQWTFRGFWRGEGEVRFEAKTSGTIVEGYERISLRCSPLLSAPIEGLFLERRFRAIWELGWRRLRRQATFAP